MIMMMVANDNDDIDDDFSIITIGMKITGWDLHTNALEYTNTWFTIYLPSSAY